MNLTWGPRWLLIRRVAKVLLWAMLLLVPAGDGPRTTDSKMRGEGGLL